MPTNQTNNSVIYFIKRVLFGRDELISINKEVKGTQDGKPFHTIEVLGSLLRENPQVTDDKDEKKIISEGEALKLVELISDEPEFGKQIMNILS